MLAIFRDGSDVLDPRTLVMNFGVLSMGLIFGGFGVGVVRWLVGDILLYNLPIWCVYAIVFGVILGGPDLLPPLTLANGCEDLTHRIIWTALMVLYCYFTIWADAYKCIMIVSGLMHIDRGDYNFKKFQYICYPRQHIALSEENVSNTITFFYLCFFRAASGVGMLWAACGVHTLDQFFKAMVVYFGINLFIYFALG